MTIEDVARLERAARVSRFMHDEKTVGRWQLHQFEVTEEDFAGNRALIMLTERHAERRRKKLEREVTPGNYVTLRRRITKRETEVWREDHANAMKLTAAAGVPKWMPVMSDTPAEIRELRHAFEHGTGNVLVNGLGLGCVIAALLSKDDVTRIDIVEIDPDVIALTGHYYLTDPRVAIHEANCMEFEPEYPSGGYDYVWHDIWTHVSLRNLDPAEAEHGISYGMLFDRYADIARDQSAWAYEHALEMQRIEEEEERYLRPLEDFWKLDFDGKIDYLVDEAIRGSVLLPNGDPAFPWPQEIPQEIIDIHEETTRAQNDGVSMRDHFREVLQEAEEAGGLTPEKFQAWIDAPEPLGNPNENLRG